MARPNKLSGKNSLCWECKNYSCPWIREGKPVKGWKAEATKIHNLEKDTDSYIVIDCPEHKDAEDMEKIKCKSCGKVLFQREKRKYHDVIAIKCPRCKKLNFTR